LAIRSLSDSELSSLDDSFCSAGARLNTFLGFDLTGEDLTDDCLLEGTTFRGFDRLTLVLFESLRFESRSGTGSSLFCVMGFVRMTDVLTILILLFGAGVMVTPGL